MTTQEFRKVIADSEHTDWFNSIEVTIKYSKVDFSQSFKGITSVHKFLSNQIKGWDNLGELPKELDTSKNNFKNLKNRLENFVKNYKDTNNTSYLTQYWRQECNILVQDANYFTYDLPHTEFLMQMYENNQRYFQGAYYFIIGSSTNLNNRNNFIGSLMAYEFTSKDHTELLQRRNKEKSSISRLRNDLRNQLSESEVQLTEHLKNSSDEYKNYVSLIDSYKSEKEELFDTWFSTSQKTFTDFDDKSKETFAKFEQDSKNKIESLENTYEEILRLKKPAEYWNLRAKQLKEEGWKAIRWLTVLIVVACITLYFLLWQTPEGMLLSFNENKSSAIKWSVIYVTFLSFLVFGVRALNRVAFSSFHLARDAEEREQLTYVYLALSKETQVDEAEKKLIMQSLFSRADTGLLKEDSSPTMPNDVVGKIFGK